MKKKRGCPLLSLQTPFRRKYNLPEPILLPSGKGQIPLSPAPLSKGTAKEQTKSDMETKEIPEMTKSRAEMTKSAPEMTKSGAEMT